MRSKKAIQKTDSPKAEYAVLLARLAEEAPPDPADVDRFRAICIENRQSLPVEATVESLIRRQIVSQIHDGQLQAVALAEIDSLQQALGYAEAPPLERILIDRILTEQLRLLFAELGYDGPAAGASRAGAMGVYMENRLDLAHRRFLKSMDALVRIRRLSQNTPALQINIASEGGKQVNVQGSGAAPGILGRTV